jgi:hypothetical protein
VARRDDFQPARPEYKQLGAIMHNGYPHQKWAFPRYVPPLTKREPVVVATTLMQLSQASQQRRNILVQERVEENTDDPYQTRHAKDTRCMEMAKVPVATDGHVAVGSVDSAQQAWEVPVPTDGHVTGGSVDSDQQAWEVPVPTDGHAIGGSVDSAQQAWEVPVSPDGHTADGPDAEPCQNMQTNSQPVDLRRKQGFTVTLLCLILAISLCNLTMVVRSVTLDSWRVFEQHMDPHSCSDLFLRAMGGKQSTDIGQMEVQSRQLVNMRTVISVFLQHVAGGEEMMQYPKTDQSCQALSGYLGPFAISGSSVGDDCPVAVPTTTPVADNLSFGKARGKLYCPSRVARSRWEMMQYKNIAQGVQYPETDQNCHKVAITFVNGGQVSNKFAGSFAISGSLEGDCFPVASPIIPGADNLPCGNKGFLWDSEVRLLVEKYKYDSCAQEEFMRDTSVRLLVENHKYSRCLNERYIRYYAVRLLVKQHNSSSCVNEVRLLVEKYKYDSCAQEEFMRDTSVRLLVENHKSRRCLNERFMKDYAVRLLVKQHNSSSYVNEGFMMATTASWLVEKYMYDSCAQEEFMRDTAVRFLVEKYKSSSCMKEGFTRVYTVRLLVKQHNSSSCVKEGFMMATAVRLLVEQCTSSSRVKEGFMWDSEVRLLVEKYKYDNCVQEEFMMVTAVRLLVEKYTSSSCVKEGFIMDTTVRLLIKQHKSTGFVKEGLMMSTTIGFWVEQNKSSNCMKEEFMMVTAVRLLVKKYKSTDCVTEGDTMDTAVRLLVEPYKSSRCENTTERNSLCKSAVRLVEQMMASMVIKKDMAISMRNKEYTGKVSVQHWDTGWIGLQLVM